jgi:transposase
MIFTECACRLCEKIFQAPAPELPIEKGRPGPGLLSHIAISKYCDGIPLYRQSVILAREGVEIDRTTMAEWIGHVACMTHARRKVFDATKSPIAEEALRRIRKLYAIETDIRGRSAD